MPRRTIPDRRNGVGNGAYFHGFRRFKNFPAVADAVLSDLGALEEFAEKKPAVFSGVATEALVILYDEVLGVPPPY